MKFLDLMSNSYYLYILYYSTYKRKIKIIDSREKHINDFIFYSEDFLKKIDIYHFAEYENKLRKITTQFNSLPQKRKKDIAIDKLFKP